VLTSLGLDPEVARARTLATILLLSLTAVVPLLAARRPVLGTVHVSLFVLRVHLTVMLRGTGKRDDRQRKQGKPGQAGGEDETDQNGCHL